MDIQHQVKLLKALAHPIRLQIVKRLVNNGESCVCDLNRCVDFSQSNLSQHLKILRDANVVSTRKNGQWMMYQVSENYIHDILHALDAIGN